MFSFAISTFVYFCIVFNYTFFGFVTGSSAIATSLGVSTVHYHMTKAVTLEVLSRLGIALEELVVVGLIVPSNVLLNHFIRMFWFTNGDKSLVDITMRLKT